MALYAIKVWSAEEFKQSKTHKRNETQIQAQKLCCEFILREL